MLNFVNAQRAGVLVETVKRYLLETPDPVEMVSFNLGQGIRHPAQARKIPGVLPLRQLPSEGMGRVRAGVNRICHAVVAGWPRDQPLPATVSFAVATPIAFNRSCISKGLLKMALTEAPCSRTASMLMELPEVTITGISG